MKVKFLKTVTTPNHRAGEPGDIKDLVDHDARELVAGGFCETAEPKPQAKKVKKDVEPA
tara:strand:+ start:769 stop:945 length:177 start_codon:yes stop_codon:yes gene_type:complete